MCGIFSLINNSYTFSPTIIRNCFNIGVNRGPEQSELKYIDDDLWFGFHRLAINGLDTGSSQPLSIDGITLICNGEIYNYKALYSLMNVTPLTSSDCEVIIHLYAQYGLEYTLQLLDGVFAFILHDLRDDTNPLLYVARDPYGVRPLYMVNSLFSYNNQEPIVGFASELKVLHSLCSSNKTREFVYSHIMPGSFLLYTKDCANPLWFLKEQTKYHTCKFINECKFIYIDRDE